VNELELEASIVERDTLRYTPVGLPLVRGILQHKGQQVEAGLPRQVEFDLLAVAAGEVSGRFANAELGVGYRFRGFLARKTRSVKTLEFHIIDFDAVA
jgi:primosomal replication protein N